MACRRLFEVAHYGMVRNAAGSEVLQQAVSEAGQRLIDALVTEAKLRSRLGRERSHRLWRRRRVAQRLVAQRAGDYTRAMRGYREAIQALFRQRRTGQIRPGIPMLSATCPIPLHAFGNFLALRGTHRFAAAALKGGRPSRAGGAAPLQFLQRRDYALQLFFLGGEVLNRLVQIHPHVGGAPFIFGPGLRRGYNITDVIASIVQSGYFGGEGGDLLAGLSRASPGPRVLAALDACRISSGD